jgi:hypothetical protein
MLLSFIVHLAAALDRAPVLHYQETWHYCGPSIDMTCSNGCFIRRAAHRVVNSLRALCRCVILGHLAAYWGASHHTPSANVPT